ncbi:MAG: hypothetical protein ACD_19C00014G0043 [uncultured bacterium]|nr:MAG: hypothetical protein ACD_19C00014G0043 [uncultured bacterium]
MEQHPIPQQISSYQFKLVGDMTLKQFFQVAGGVIISLIFYSTSLHPLIKWPFILSSAGMGAALAFLPFEERPLERWIFAFFRSIYSPTLYFWKKTDKPPVFYTETAVAPAITAVGNTNPVVETNTAKLEDAEKTFLQKIGGLFTINNQSPTTKNQTTQKMTPIQQSVSVTFAQPVVSTVPDSSLNPHSSNPVVSVPQQVPTIITKSAPRLVVEESTPTINKQAPIVNIEAQKLEQKEITSNTVEFSVDAAPPSPPIAINTITGQVMDSDRKIIEGAILEIKDSNSRPVRALKSNKAGHFIIVTPLANGKYEVTIEKEGFTFETVSFEAKGETIPAIAIRGTRI